jgi:hypothetical protein
LHRGNSATRQAQWQEREAVFFIENRNRATLHDLKGKNVIYKGATGRFGRYSGMRGSIFLFLKSATKQFYRIRRRREITLVLLETTGQF